MKKALNKNKLFEIIPLLILTVFIFIFWETPFVYPIKWFVVLIHEINHALMAYLTGGTAKIITFNFNLSGLTKTVGGNLILIASAGYLGSLIIGALLFIAPKFPRLKFWLTSILSLTIIIASINLIKGGIHIFFSLIVAISIFLIPRYIPEKYSNQILQFLGLTSCLYVIADIKHDLITTTLRETDTQILEYITGIPSILIGIAWLILSILVLFVGIRVNLKKTIS